MYGLMIDYLAYKHKDYEDKRLELTELKKPKPFSVDTCTEDELLERCKTLRFSEENTNLAIEFFIKKTKQSLIAERLCTDEKYVKLKKHRLKQKLNT